MSGGRESETVTGEFLARSRTRRQILGQIRTDSYDLRDLSDELDTPRTTVQDNLYKMEERDLARRNHEGEYVATPLGLILVEEFREFGQTAQTAEKLEPFLRHVDNPGDHVDISVLEGGTLVAPTDQNPYNPTHRLLEELDESSCLRALIPVVTPTCIRQIRESATQGRLDAELLLGREAMRCLEEDYTEPFATDTWNRQLSVGVCRERLPFELFIFDDQRITIRSFDDQRKPSALVVSEGEGVCRWARETYESYRSVVPAEEPVQNSNLVIPSH